MGSHSRAVVAASPPRCAGAKPADSGEGREPRWAVDPSTIVERQGVEVPRAEADIIDSLRDQRGRSALFNATLGGHVPTIEMLLEHKANPNALDGSEGLTLA